MSALSCKYLGAKLVSCPVLENRAEYSDCRLQILLIIFSGA